MRRYSEADADADSDSDDDDDAVNRGSDSDDDAAAAVNRDSSSDVNDETESESGNQGANTSEANDDPDISELIARITDVTPQEEESINDTSDTDTPEEDFQNEYNNESEIIDISMAMKTTDEFSEEDYYDE